jgi:hypothetical protein
LEGDFEVGKIHGHAVFRYPTGDKREGFFRENVLDGQVQFINVPKSVFSAENSKLPVGLQYRYVV